MGNVLEQLTGMSLANGVSLDLSVANPAVPGVSPTGNTDELSAYIFQTIQNAGAQFGFGGYLEKRGFYPAHLFGGEEPRNIHLGLDIWMPAGSPVYLPMDGVLHSFADNSAQGDYGPTLIVEHALAVGKIYSLYGHLSRQSLKGKSEGMDLKRGQQLATLGEPHENVGWPPHLHFQLIRDLKGMHGDFPGVAKESELAYWHQNCPDPLMFGF